MNKIKNFLKNSHKSSVYKILGGTILVFLFTCTIYFKFSQEPMKSNMTAKPNEHANSNAMYEEIVVEEMVENQEPTQEPIPENFQQNVELKPKQNTSSNMQAPQEQKRENQESSTKMVENKSEEDADQTISAYFNQTKADLEDMNLRDKAKENFILIVDFLFYDGKIKGHTFNELSTKVKLKVLQVALMIDKQIDHYFPDYKETISSKTKKAYTNLKEAILLKYMEITSSICSKDEEICNSAKSDFQDMKKSFSITWDFLKTLARKGGTSIKTWYEIYSGK